MTTIAEKARTLRLLSPCVVLLLCLGIFLPSPSWSTIPPFPPQNVILIYADDVELNDLPIFGTELSSWQTENEPMELATTSTAPRFGESIVTHVGLGRLRARILATTRLYEEPTEDGDLGRYPGDGPLAVPIDLDDPSSIDPDDTITYGQDPSIDHNVEHFRYQPDPNCETADETTFASCKGYSDIRRTHGGFKTLSQYRGRGCFPGCTRWRAFVARRVAG